MGSRNFDSQAISKTAKIKSYCNIENGRKSIDGSVRASADLLPSIKEIAARSAAKTTAKSYRNNYYTAIRTGDTHASSRASSRVNI